MTLAWNEWVSVILLVIGCSFVLTGALGIIRLPDFYTRLHGAGLIDTLGQGLVLLGCAFQLVGHTSTPWQTGMRLFLIFISILITSPTSTHAISRAAFISGLRPALGVELAAKAALLEEQTQAQKCKAASKESENA